jgi:hypothetical protein
VWPKNDRTAASEWFINGFFMILTHYKQNYNLETLGKRWMELSAAISDSCEFRLMQQDIN